MSQYLKDPYQFTNKRINTHQIKFSLYKTKNRNYLENIQINKPLNIEGVTAKNL